jgi:SAM-dependent methyltransferase
MTTPFGSVYAEHYDLFYRRKDYGAECDFLEAVFRRHSVQPVHSVLDLGCGTGGHVLRLAERGYAVTGVDRSAAMLAEAQRVRSAQPVNAGKDAAEVGFYLGDVRTVDLGRSYDAAIMMFAVLGYQTGNDDVAAALATVRRHLAPGGLAVADFWYGPAVLTERPSDRVQEWTEDGARIMRIVRSQLNVRQHTVDVRYTVLRLEESVLQAQAEEVHTMRFFFPQELAYFASQAGLELLALCPMLDMDGQVDESTWNVCAVMGMR